MTVRPQYRISGGSAREIADSVEAGIEAGELPAGERLPSVRALATDLGVSPSTVAAALAELRSRGLVVSRARSGTQVAWRAPIAAPSRLAFLPAGVRNLADGNPDPALLPDLAPHLATLSAPGNLYGGTPFLPELREPAAAELEADGIDASHLTVVSGAIDGIERAAAAWLRSGDAVAVEDPGFAGLFDALRALGLVLRPVETDDRGMLPGSLSEALTAGVAAVVVNGRGQNPTGATLDGGRAAELAAALDPHPDVLLIEDDHLGPIAGRPRITLTGGRRRWAAARSVSKSLGPDLRLAILAGDTQTISRVAGRHAVGPGWVSHILQRLVAALWVDPATPAALERAAAAYDERRRALLAALAESGLEARGGEAGLAVWVPVAEETATIQALAAAGWGLAPGAPFRLRSGPAVRVTTSTLLPADAPELAAALAGAAAGPGLRGA